MNIPSAEYIRYTSAYHDLVNKIKKANAGEVVILPTITYIELSARNLITNGKFFNVDVVVDDRVYLRQRIDGMESSSNV